MRTFATLLALMVPLAVNAQITFERTYGGPHADIGCSVQQTSDGGYIIAGGTSSFGAGSGDVYLIETDSIGDTVWTRTYGGPDWDWGYSVEETSDGGYIIAGGTSSFGADSSDVYLVKTDGVGDRVWTRTYGGPDEDCGYSVAQTSDGGYVVAGATKSFGAGSEDVYLIKTDSVGDTVRTRTYGGPSVDYGYSVEETSDGGYVIAGGTSSFGAGSGDVYLIKTDSVGDTVWTGTCGGPDDDWGYSVEETSDGGYIIAGGTSSFGAGSIDVYLIRTDSVGDTVWTRTYGGPDDDWSWSVEETSDGGYIIAGFTSSFGAGSHDIYLIKTDADGLVQVTDGDQKSPRPGLSYLAQNYPNPFRAATTITYALPLQLQITLAIYDIRGALVRTLLSFTGPAGQHEVIWDGRDGRGHRVSSGVYFCRLEAGDHTETKRMVLLR